MTSLSGFKLSIFVVIFRILRPFVVRHFVFSCLVFVREFVVGLTMSSAPSPITVLCIGHSHSAWLRTYVEAAEWFAVGWRVYFCSNFVTNNIIVRPILENSCTVWDPYTATQINKLEMIQRRAARYVLHRHHNTSSVTNMLQSLGWRSLADRRKDAKLCMLYKI